MNLKKNNKSQMNASVRHDYRDTEYCRSNTNIDQERTHLNYGWPPTLEEAEERVRAVYDGVFESKRCRSVSSAAVVTLPHELQKIKENETPEEQLAREERQDAFFNATLEAYGDKFGRDNILCATVHNDEKTPHIHIQIAAIVEDRNPKHLEEKWLSKHPEVQVYEDEEGKYIKKVSNKEAFPRDMFKTLHQDMSIAISEKMGEEISLLRYSPEERLERKLKEANKSINYLKQQDGEKGYDADNLEYWTKKAETISKELAAMKKENDTLEKALDKSIDEQAEEYQNLGRETGVSIDNNNTAYLNHDILDRLTSPMAKKNYIAGAIQQAEYAYREERMIDDLRPLNQEADEILYDIEEKEHKDKYFKSSSGMPLLDETKLYYGEDKNPLQAAWIEYHLDKLTYGDEHIPLTEAFASIFPVEEKLQEAKQKSWDNNKPEPMQQEEELERYL